MKKTIRISILMAILLIQLTVAQTVYITGTILDSIASQPVSGARISLLGQPQVSILSDNNGAFKLSHSATNTYGWYWKVYLRR